MGASPLRIHRGLPQREGALFHQRDKDGVGIAPMHFGRCNPVQTRQAVARPEQVGTEDGLAGLHRQHFQDLLVGRAAVAGDVDFGNAETGMSQRLADAIVDGAKTPTDHAAGEQSGEQRQHHRQAGHGHHRTVGEEGETRHHPAEKARRLFAAHRAGLDLGQVAARLIIRRGGAHTLRTGGLATAFAVQGYRSHDASSTIQRHNFA
jgi:hypothetical protein